MSSGGGTNTISPPWARGLCDICGFSFPLNSLRAHIYDGREDGLLVCEADWDKDNPQLQLGRIAPVYDPQSLTNPRPDTGVLGSTGLFGWLPVGNVLTNIECQVGNLVVLVT